MMTATEITQAQWDALCFDDPSGHAPTGVDDGIGANYPVGNITYWEALSYANALSQLNAFPPCYVLSGCTGSVGHGLACMRNDTATTFYDCPGFRLPSDAEYEYADRAGTTTATYAGDVLDQPEAGIGCYPDPAIDTIGWCCESGATILTTQPVGKKTPNAWGLYDMIGNAIEWVDGTFDGLGYGPGPLTDPFGTVGATRDDAGLDLGGIWRGGRFSLYNGLCRSAARFQAPRSGISGAGVGFRLVRTAGSDGG